MRPLQALFLLTSLATASSAAAYCGPYAVDADTGALWHFEEGSGTFALDSAHRIIATFEGASFSPDGAPFGGSFFSVDVGQGRFVTVGGVPALNPRDQITVEAWIFPRSLDANRSSGIIRKNDAFASENYSLGFDGSDVLRFSLNAGGSVHVAIGVVSVQMNQWIHVAGTYDGTTLKVFLNGDLVGSNHVTGQIAPDTTPLYIGRGSIEEPFDGLVDEVRISRRARTPDEFNLDVRRLETFTDRRTARTGSRVRAFVHFAAPCGGSFALDVTQENPDGSTRVLDRRQHFVAPVGFDETRTAREHVFDGHEQPGTYRLHVRIFDGGNGRLLDEQTSALQFTP